MREHSDHALVAGIANQNKIEKTKKDDHYAATHKPKGARSEAREHHERHRNMKKS
jgi:hypothetical protein